MIFPLEIKDCTPHIHFSEMQSFIRSLPDGKYTIRIEKEKSRRTNQQNKYIWGVIVEILFNEVGQWSTKDECYDFLKYQFNSQLVVIGGKEYLIGKSIAETDTAKCAEICQKIREWALIELQIRIPEPNEP